MLEALASANEPEGPGPISRAVVGEQLTGGHAKATEVGYGTA
jgi:hypothetical protein